jgi:hypothetical protein
MVAETLLSDEPGKRRQAPVRKILFFLALAILAAGTALFFYLSR